MKNGFTLIELIIVLLILAIVTHLSVREMSKVKDSRLRETANTQMQSIKDAVWKNNSPQKPSGFLADLGRLPYAREVTYEKLGTSLTIEELWVKPFNVKPFAFRYAVESNLVVRAEDKSDLIDKTIRIGCGWRGAYLNIRSRNLKLYDPWGNPMENKDLAGYDRLFNSNGEAAKDGEQVFSIRHLGSDGRLDSDVPPASESERDLSIDLIPRASLKNTLSLNVSFHNASGDKPISGDIRCRWYAPCGSSITGGVAKATLSDETFKTFEFENLPPCECLLAIDIGGVNKKREFITIPFGGTSHETKVFIK
ncbi:MAG: prepilin-type N-terminal cleavage/methylation domain-containing protein [Kiritimatiellae bacterium]|nr:prepilin-type N-terminal cleavage/methylation domain-containing protein [Kiritimatiellia bacterium]